MNKKIAVIGGALRDIILVTDSGTIINNIGDFMRQKLLGFELGAKTSITKFLNTVGGSACNVSIGLKKMGADPFPYVEVGDDIIGKIIKDDLEKFKISAKLVGKDKANQTGFSIIIVDSQSREHIVFCKKEASEDIKINVKKILSINPAWIYIGSLGSDPENEFEKIKLIKEKIKKIKIAAAPGIGQIEKKNKRLLEILKISDIIIMNRDEAISMLAHSNPKNYFNLPPRGLAQIRFLFNESKNWGDEKIAITDGKDGVYLKDGRNSRQICYIESFPPSKLVDTTGAGDAFASGFIGGLIRGIKVEDCLKMGIVNSSSVVEYLGAEKGLLTWEKARKKIKELEVKIL